MSDMTYCYETLAGTIRWSEWAYQHCLGGPDGCPEAIATAATEADREWWDLAGEGVGRRVEPAVAAIDTLRAHGEYLKAAVIQLAATDEEKNTILLDNILAGDGEPDGPDAAARYASAKLIALRAR